MPKKLPDVRKHVASRHMVRRILERQKVHTVSKRYDHGSVVTRVLVGDKYFDVDNRQLDLLEMGKTPAQLGIEPIAFH